MDRGDDEYQAFKANFTAEGSEKLRETVREKLLEIMDYKSDDSLVEYVMVLLRNGRHKDEAREELDVFLGENSATFISWLWNHLSSSLHLYVQSEEGEHDHNESKKNQKLKEYCGRHRSSLVQLTSKGHTDSEHASESSIASRHKREWKGLVREGSESFPLRSVLTDILHSGEKKVKSNDVKLSQFSHSHIGRKRSREDEPKPTKRELPSHPVVDAPRRLLQFAVRDAVKTVQQTASVTEPSSKRLRSVVSTSSTEPVQDKSSHRSRRVLQAPGAALALKAAAEAAEDVTKVRSSGSVFDRLGQGKGRVEHVIQQSHFREEHKDYEEDYEDSDQVVRVNSYDRHQFSDYEEDVAEDAKTLDKDSEMNDDSPSDNDEYSDDGSIRQHALDSFNDDLSTKQKKALAVQHSIEPENNVLSTERLVDHDQPRSSSPSNKGTDNSGKVNALEFSNYGRPKDVHVVENQKSVDKVDMTAGKPGSIPGESALADNPKESGQTNVQKESLRTPAVSSLYSTTHPMEDADWRTLYVSNVHFAATKDSLSRHFNQFGAVLKVIIVTNAATGQPTGSAYVEFLHKESAERALSLNGTSFMTRVLKVVRRSSHEAAQFFGWPGSGRSLFARHGRMAYPRSVLPGAFRNHLPIKPGARSLQWKREPASMSSAGAKPDTRNVSLSSAEQVLP